LRCGLVLFIALGGWSLSAAEPDVQTVNVRGLQVGATTTITIDGDRLGGNPRLLLPFRAKSTVKPGATEKKVTLDVELGGSIVPGYHHLRLATDGGVSLPVIIGVDRLPQLPPSQSIGQLPCTMTGTVINSSIDETTFTGKAGEKVLVEIEAQRLGSKLRPVVHLYGPKRVQVGWSWPTAALHGDTRLEATLPADGTYTIAVHDLEYAGPPPGFFRLKVGQWSQVDQVFPPVAGKESKSVELIGPGNPVRVDLPAMATGPYAKLDFPKDGLWSGPRPIVELSGRPEMLEQPANGKAQDLPAGPVAVSGRLGTAFEEDLYRLPVTPGTRLRLEVFAERLGSPIDVALVVRNEAGAEVARAEDSPGTLDPALEYAVPDRVTAIQVGVIDSQGRGGPRGIYRLTVDPVPPAGPPEPRLFTPGQRVSLANGGRYVLPVFADRRGYAGRIDLAASGLQPSAKIEGTTIAADADGVLVTITAIGAGPAGVTNWHGRTADGRDVPVVLRGHPLERLQPWLATELAFAPTTAKADEFTLDWRGLAADAGLSPAGKLALPVKVQRADPAAPVRFTLLTSQAPPLANGQPNPNAAIRAERPVELAAKATDAEVPVVVPPELSADAYDVAVQAELLAADKRAVLATAFTPVRRLAVKRPVALKLEGPATVEAKLDPKAGATVEVVGQVERLNGFKGEATVTLTGVPAGVRADPVTVKADATRFTMKVVVPPTTPPGETKGLKLAATVAPDPKQPNQRVRGRDVDLTLVVQAGKK
jgi:hypothetical protein